MPETVAAGKAFCPHCQKDVDLKPENPEWGNHVLLCVITLGLYLPLWIFHLLSPKTGICAACGGAIPLKKEEREEPLKPAA